MHTISAKDEVFQCRFGKKDKQLIKRKLYSFRVKPETKLERFTLARLQMYEK